MNVREVLAGVDWGLLQSLPFSCASQAAEAEVTVFPPEGRFQVRTKEPRNRCSSSGIPHCGAHPTSCRQLWLSGEAGTAAGID